MLSRIGPSVSRFVKGSDPVRAESLDQFDLVADGDLAARDDSRQHPALALELRAQALAQLVHAVARIADHHDLEHGRTRTHALTDRPLLHVVALDGQVLADRARVDADRVQMLLRDEENLALRRIRVRAALEALASDRQPALVPVRATALASRRGPDTDDSSHGSTLAATPV